MQACTNLVPGQTDYMCASFTLHHQVIHLNSLALLSETGNKSMCWWTCLEKQEDSDIIIMIISLI